MNLFYNRILSSLIRAPKLTLALIDHGPICVDNLPSISNHEYNNFISQNILEIKQEGQGGKNQKKRFHSAHRNYVSQNKKQKSIQEQQDLDLNEQQLSYDYRGEYYPPPKHLHHELAGKIKKILHRDSHEDFKSLLSNLEEKQKSKQFLQSEQKKNNKDKLYKQSHQQQQQQQQQKNKKISTDIYSHAYEQVEDDEIFIDPTQYDLFKNKRFSKFQEQYIREYQDYMEKDKNEKGYLEHPDMVDNLLFTQLSLSAIATHQWKSKRAQMNLLKLKPQTKNICHYPLSPRVVQEIEAIEQKS